MEFTPATHRRLEIAGALFGLALAAVLLWTTQIAPILALRGVPIEAASFGISPSALALIAALNLAGVTLGAYLVARFWDQSWAALLAGGALTMLVQIGTAYLVTTSALAGNSFAELILFRLPLGLLFGGLLWLLGGMLGALLERLALRGVARLMPRSLALAMALAIAAGAALGLVAGGSSEQREASAAAARAVETALRESTGRPPDPAITPARYHASGPARRALATLADQGDVPYQIMFVEYDGREVVTLVQYPGGAAVRCVSTGPVISRCFRDE